MLDDTDHRPSVSESPSILVIATWLERDGLRARITASELDGPSDRTVRVVTTTDDAVEFVRSWIERFVAGSGPTRA